MKNQPLTLFPALLLAATGGCSARVEVSDVSTTEKSRVAVEVGVLADRESEPAPAAPTAIPEKGKVAQESRLAPEPMSRKEEQSKPVKVVRNVVTIHEGDLHLHEHLHVHGSARRRRERAVKVRVEVVQQRQPNERCERLIKEHLSRLSKWEAMFQRGGR